MAKAQIITISTEYITLGQFLKFAQIIDFGGEAKMFLLENDVYVDGQIEPRRGRKLRGGEIVQVLGKSYVVTRDDPNPPEAA